MQNKIIPVVVEKEGVSDDVYTVIDLHFDEAAAIEKDDIIITIESSKASIEIEAPESGNIYFDINEKDEVKAGQIIAAITKSESFDNNWFQTVNNAPKQEQNKTVSSNIRISKAAQDLINKHDIDIENFKGKTILSKDDVEKFLRLNIDISTLKKSYKTSDIFIYGGGGHGGMCIDILKQMDDYEIIGIVDSQKPVNEKVMNIPVLGDFIIVDELVKRGIKNAILGIGSVLNNKIRVQLYKNLINEGLHIPNIIHPSASIEDSVQMGTGNQVMQGAIIGSNVKIGNNCIINSGSIISHDSVIGDNVHITPGAILAGNVTIGNNSVIGMGSTIFLKVKIGSNVMINNGVHVFTDVKNGEHIRFTQLNQD